MFIVQLKSARVVFFELFNDINIDKYNKCRNAFVYNYDRWQSGTTLLNIKQRNGTTENIQLMILLIIISTVSAFSIKLPKIRLALLESNVNPKTGR